MSTKTSIKRIALVAAAALALGGFSAVSANAAALDGNNPGFTITAGASSYTNATTGAVSATDVGSAVDGDQVKVATATVGSAVTVRYYVATGSSAFSPSVTGAVFLAATVADDTAATPTGFIPGSNVFYAVTDNVGDTFDSTQYIEMKVFSTTPGTATVTIGASTATITYGAASTVSAQYSTSFITARNDDTVPATADTASLTGSKTAGSQRAQIAVAVRDSAGNLMEDQGLSASISGPGLLGIANTDTLSAVTSGEDSTTATGRSITVAASNANTAYFFVTVWSDGTAGTSTITLTSGTTQLATETITFVGTPATVKSTQNLKVAKASTQLGANPSTVDGTNGGDSYATTVAFTAEILDSNGNAVGAGATTKLTSSDSSVITVGTCAENATYSGNFECSVSGAQGAASGKSATVTLSVLNTTTGLFDIVANALTFSVGGSIATVAVTTDKATYTAGEAMVITATAKDSSGNAAYDGQAPYSDTVSSSKTISSLPAVATAQIVGGVNTTKTYAPVTSGDFVITGETTDALTGTAFSASASVEADQSASLALDAANAATDAANNAYDEAQNATQAASDALAAVTALAAQVKSLIASVKKLTSAVAKLKK
ncbi:hypothetical protein MCEMZLE42_01313 [actinobacterium SCGC AAA044-D11]